LIFFFIYLKPVSINRFKNGTGLIKIFGNSLIQSLTSTNKRFYLFKKHLEEINDNVKIFKLRGHNPSKTFDLIRTLYNHYTEESLPFTFSVVLH